MKYLKSLSENETGNVFIDTLLKYKKIAVLDLSRYPPSRKLQVCPSILNLGVQGEKGSYPAIA